MAHRKFPLALLFSAAAVLFCLVFSASAFAELHNISSPDLGGEFKAGGNVHVNFGSWGGAAHPPIGQQAFYEVCKEETCGETGGLSTEGQIQYSGSVSNPGARIPRYINVKGTELESAGLFVRNQEFAFTESLEGGSWRYGPWDELKLAYGPLHEIAASGPPIANVTLPTLTGTYESGKEVSLHLGTWSGGEGTKTYSYDIEAYNSADEPVSSVLAGETTNVAEVPTAEIPAEDIGDHLVASVEASDPRGAEWAATADSEPSEEITTSELTTVEITPLSHNFGTHSEHEAELATQEFTVKNTGSVPLFIGSVTKTGEAPEQFPTGTNTCTGHAIAPEATCIYEVAFEPRIAAAPNRVGEVAAELNFHDNVAGSPQVVDVSGTIEEGAPVVSTPFPEVSGTLKPGHTVTTSNGTWLSGSTVTYSYRWEVCTYFEISDCSPVGDTTNEYTIPNSASGQYLIAWVTATNAKGSTEEDSYFYQVEEVKPENAVAPAISGTTEVGQTVSASTGTWNGKEPFEYSYQWEHCNSSGASCSAISGAESSTYTIASEYGGSVDTLRVLVTAKNTVSEATAESAHSSIITGGSEIAPGAPSTPTLSSNTPVKGTSLESSAGTGSTGGVPTPTYKYQWQNCTTTSTSSCANISGAESRSYTPVSGDVGKYLRVAVTAENTAGSASSYSAESTASVRSVPGEPSTPTLSSNTPAYGVALESSAATGSTGGEPAPTYAYQWQSCTEAAGGCSSISGAIHQAYTPGEADVGKYLRVGVTATNSAGSSATAYSAESTEGVTGVAPTKPEEPVLNAYRPAVGRSINLMHVGGSTGVPAPTYLYQWERCTTKEVGSCVEISGATHSHYMPTSADLGKYLRLKIESENSTGTWVDPSEPEFSPPAGPVDSEGSVVCENVSPAPGGSHPTGPATACTEVEEVVSGSALTLTAEVADTATPTVLGPKDEIEHYSIHEDTGDDTGTGDGWNETISQGTFTSGSHTIGSNSGSGEVFKATTGAEKVGRASGNTGAAVTSDSYSDDAENTDTNPIEESPIADPVNVPVPTTSHSGTADDAPNVVFDTAEVGTGMGNFVVTPTVSFDVPANTYAGSYTTITEVDLSTGP